jgi:hypothetical protein
MNIDHILDTLNRHDVRSLLIGGVNYMLRHQPILTYDVDVWIEDEALNRRRCEEALSALDCAWGESEQTWRPVSNLSQKWLDRQSLFCLSSPHGAIDIFRALEGLNDWQSCRDRAIRESTASGISYWGLCDEDMLQCQLALAVELQKQERVLALRKALDRKGN